MKRYDLIFFIVMIGSMVLILNAVAFNFYTPFLNLWYLLLLPFAYIKVFRVNSKIDKWLNERI